jgi:hypothetical protein
MVRYIPAILILFLFYGPTFGHADDNGQVLVKIQTLIKKVERLEAQQSEISEMQKQILEHIQNLKIWLNKRR